MTRTVILCALALIAGHLSAATFTATGTSADVSVANGNTLNVVLSGAWVATVNIEQKVGGTAYTPIYVAQANLTYTITTPGTYRLNCVAYTSGTVTYTITSPAGYQVNYLGPNGQSVFSVDNNGVVTAPTIASSATAITGGTINGTTIGGTTPSTGAFTTLTANGATTLTAGTASTTTGTGTLVITGGEGVSGNIFSGGNIAADVVGFGLQVKEGTNAKMGTAVLVAGASTVADTAVTATSRIYLTSQADGGTPGFLRVSARTAGTSFTITSSSGTDTSTVAYMLVEPAP